MSDEDVSWAVMQLFPTERAWSCRRCTCSGGCSASTTRTAARSRAAREGTSDSAPPADRCRARVAPEGDATVGVRPGRVARDARLPARPSCAAVRPHARSRRGSRAARSATGRPRRNLVRHPFRVFHFDYQNGTMCNGECSSAASQEREGQLVRPVPRRARQGRLGEVRLGEGRPRSSGGGRDAARPHRRSVVATGEGDRRGVRGAVARRARPGDP